MDCVEKSAEYPSYSLNQRVYGAYSMLRSAYAARVGGEASGHPGRSNVFSRFASMFNGEFNGEQSWSSRSQQTLRDRVANMEHAATMDGGRMGTSDEKGRRKWRCEASFCGCGPPMLKEASTHVTIGKSRSAQQHRLKNSRIPLLFASVELANYLSLVDENCGRFQGYLPRPTSLPQP